MADEAVVQDDEKSEEQKKFEGIMRKMEKAGDYLTSKGSAVMKIINREGDETVMGLILFEKKSTNEADDDLSLMRFTSPARLKGTAILVKGNSIWYYNNRTNRVRLLSQSAKKGSMMGSGFSYEDMELSYSKDFTGEVVSEGRKHYTLKLWPKQEKNYAYMIVRTRKADHQVESAEYYNEDDLIYKVLTSRDYKKIKGKVKKVVDGKEITVVKERIMPMLVEMKEIEDGKITRIESNPKDIQYDIEIDDNIFSERNLRK